MYFSVGSQQKAWPRFKVGLLPQGSKSRKPLTDVPSCLTSLIPDDLFAFMCKYHMDARCLQRSEKGIGSPGTELQMIVSHHVDAGI